MQPTPNRITNHFNTKFLRFSPIIVDITFKYINTATFSQNSYTETILIRFFMIILIFFLFLLTFFVFYFIKDNICYERYKFFKSKQNRSLLLKQLNNAKWRDFVLSVCDSSQFRLHFGIQNFYSEN